MNLRDVQYFAVIAEHGHLGRAAEALGMSQPALSMSLRRLEQFMQTKLVKRTPKGVDLTAPGEAVFAHARRLRLSVEDISREVADLSQARTGHLRIGTAPAFAHDLVARVCEILHQQAPKITFKVVTGDREARVGGLRSGTLDLVITSLLPERHEDLTEEPLHDEEFVVYCSATHPLAKRRPLRVADLAQERWALPGLNEPPWRHLSQALGNAGLPAPVVGIETTDLTLRQRMVASSRMLTFGSREAAKHAAGRLRVVELPVKDLIYVRRVGVLYRRDSYLSPAARRFIEILKVTCGQVAARTR